MVGSFPGKWQGATLQKLFTRDACTRTMAGCSCRCSWKPLAIIVSKPAADFVREHNVAFSRAVSTLESHHSVVMGIHICEHHSLNGGTAQILKSLPVLDHDFRVCSTTATNL
eukprot:1157097-Pelagomonas_calceolata.AAC.1